VADVKNLPIICKYPVSTSSERTTWNNLYQDKRKPYSPYGDNLDIYVNTLMKDPKLILKSGFISHENILKCPRGSKTIKPYKEKDYEIDKLAINKAYIGEIKKRFYKDDGVRLSSVGNETHNILFFIYLLSIQNNTDFEKYKFPSLSCKSFYYPDKYNYVEYFPCMKRYFYKKQAEKNNKDYIEINGIIVELPSKKISSDELKKANLNFAINNLPNLCKMLGVGMVKTNRKVQLNLGDSYSDINNWDEDIAKFNQLISTLSKYPGLFFTKDLGFSKINCTANWAPKKIITIKPYDKKALEKGEYKLSKAYLNNVKKLYPEDKEKLKFLINLITLSENITIPSDVDNKTRKTFKINYGNLKTAYDKLQNNETYQFVRKVNRARVAFKILLLLL
jgi:hypothetical protein|tara:strand:- start:49 stop:1224 length:1176 start_codon:yes stop_codon:yes gene_type:complete